jgi:RNA polymerase sigma-70 factor (ECF subfamily)
MSERTDDSAELRRVYRVHVRAVYGFFAYSVDPHTAEDLTSATFVRVIAAWSGFDPRRASERTWILAIARNILTDHFRRQSHRVGPSLDQHPAILERLTTVEDPLARRMSVDAAKEWLVQLNTREQEVIALRYGGDLTGAEIAEATGLRIDNVHQILSRALRRLRAAAMQGELNRNA